MASEAEIGSTRMSVTRASGIIEAMISEGEGADGNAAYSAYVHFRNRESSPMPPRRSSSHPEPTGNADDAADTSVGAGYDTSRLSGPTFTNTWSE